MAWAPVTKNGYQRCWSRVLGAICCAFKLLRYGEFGESGLQGRSQGALSLAGSGWVRYIQGRWLLSTHIAVC